MSTGPTAPAAPGTGTGGTGFWRSRTALVMPAVLVAIAVFLGVGVSRMQVAGDAELFGPRAFPLMVIAGLVLVAVLLTISIVADPEVPEVPDQAPEGTEARMPATNWRAVAVTVGSVAVFIALLETAGWIIAAAVLFAGVATGLGGRRYLLNVGVGLAISSTVQLVFVGLLGLSLPAGIMGVF